MSTYQDRAKTVLSILYNWGAQDALEGNSYHEKDHVDQALSELASIVEEEKSEAFKQGYIKGGLAEMEQK